MKYSTSRQKPEPEKEVDWARKKPGEKKKGNTGGGGCYKKLHDMDRRARALSREKLNTNVTKQSPMRQNR